MAADRDFELEGRTVFWHDDDGIQRELELAPGSVITVGRGEGNTIVLNDDRVSREHARIWLQGQEVWAEDLQSANGTHLNDRAVGREQWPLDDTLTIGTTQFALRPVARTSPTSEMPHGGLPRENAPQGTNPGQVGAKIVKLRWSAIDSASNSEESRNLRPGTVLEVGRDSRSDIALQSDLVSRRHAKISIGHDSITVTDLNSRNGILLAANKVQECAWQPGEELQIGDRIFQYEWTNVTATPIQDAVVHSPKTIQESEASPLLTTARHPQPATLPRLPHRARSSKQGEAASSASISVLFTQGRRVRRMVRE